MTAGGVQCACRGPRGGRLQRVGRYLLSSWCWGQREKRPSCKDADRRWIKSRDGEWTVGVVAKMKTVAFTIHAIQNDSAIMVNNLTLVGLNNLTFHFMNCFRMFFFALL